MQNEISPMIGLPPLGMSEPVHGKTWELLKYEWRDGRGRYLYGLRTDEAVTQEVWRDQPKYLVGGAR